MRAFLTVLFWLFFALSSAICVAVAFVLWIVTAPFDRQRRINHLWSCCWSYLYIICYPGWRVRVTGRERIAKDRAYVIVANHTSIADIVLLFALFRQFKWVSKESVFNVPALGWNMRMCAYVPLRRGDKESIARMLDQSKEWLRRGMSILMFPEGTRSKDGLVQPFKHGAFTLALDTGASVVPVAVHGGHRLIPKHGLVFNHSVDLLIEVLDPIPSDGFSDVDSLAVESRRRICAALGQENAARDAAEAAVAAEATARSLRADSEPRCV